MQTSAISGQAWLRGIALTLWLVGMTTAATAQATTSPVPEAIPVERFFQRPALLEAKLSPSGRLLALTSARGTNRVSLFIVALGSTPEVQSVAQFSDADIVRVDWVGDERLVFSVVDLASGSGEDRRQAPGLFAINADGSAAAQPVCARRRR